MLINGVNTKNDIFLIAEIGNNHEGSFELASKMVQLAFDAGADAVKFQTFKTEQYVSNKDEQRFNRLKKYELTYEEFAKLSCQAKDLGLAFISTPFDLESAKFLSSIADAIKISSGDNNFFPLIKEVAASGLPILMSTGIVDKSTLARSVDLIEEVRKRDGLNPGFALLHCVSAYPVSPKDANLNAIKKLREIFNLEIGYSDHTDGMEASLLAVAFGAKIIEKHFTIDKNFSDFRDHKLSADFEEFKRLSNSIRKASLMLGDGLKELRDAEVGSATSLRRSIVANRDLKKGSIVSGDDITWIRPGGGLPPGEEEKIIGKKLKVDLLFGEQLSFDVLG